MTARIPAARPRSASSVPPWTLAVGAMLSVQLGSALSVPLIVGAAGTAWLGLTAGAIVFLVIARPRCGRSGGSICRL